MINQTAGMGDANLPKTEWIKLKTEGSFGSRMMTVKEGDNEIEISFDTLTKELGVQIQQAANKPEKLAILKQKVAEAKGLEMSTRDVKVFNFASGIFTRDTQWEKLEKDIQNLEKLDRFISKINTSEKDKKEIQRVFIDTLFSAPSGPRIVKFERENVTFDVLFDLMNKKITNAKTQSDINKVEKELDKLIFLEKNTRTQTGVHAYKDRDIKLQEMKIRLDENRGY